MHKAVNTLTLSVATCGATPEIHRSAGLSQIWEFHYTRLGVMISTMVILADTTVLSKLGMFDNDDV